MPGIPPPARVPGDPVVAVLPAGSTVVRAHLGSRSPVAFNTTPRPPPRRGAPIQGGRFDSVDGSYAYLYAAITERGAFAEAFARDLDYTVAGPRPLPLARIAGKEVSRVRTVRDAQLVVLHGAASQQLGQDDWLTRCDEAGYPICREWAQALRGWAPHADGLTWRSKRDPEQQVLMLWGDPLAAGTGCGLVVSTGAAGQPLDHGPARVRLDSFLVEWRLYLEP